VTRGRTRSTEVKIVEGVMHGIGTLLRALFRRSRGLALGDREQFRMRLNELSARAQTPNAHERAMVLIEADSLFDAVLRALHLPGQTMAERLRSASSRFGRFDAVWDAHRSRNRLVHEHDQGLSSEELLRALQAYTHALSRLGV